MFYVRDWLSDAELRAASLTSRAIWIDLLCYMWVAHERGTLIGTIKALATMTGSTPEEFALFLDEARRLDFAVVTCHGNVTDCHSEVTLQNRRMVRAEKERNGARLRKAKERERKRCHTEVTAPLAFAFANASSSGLPPSSVFSSNSSGDTSVPASDEAEKFYKTKRKRKLTGWRLDWFERFWKVWSFPQGKAEAADAWLDIEGLTPEMAETAIIPAAEREARARPALIQGGNKPKWAQGWLNGKRWEDEPAKNGTDGEWKFR